MSGFAPDFLRDKLGPNFIRVVWLRATSLQKHPCITSAAPEHPVVGPHKLLRGPLAHSSWWSGIECWTQGGALAHIQRPF